MKGLMDEEQMKEGKRLTLQKPSDLFLRVCYLLLAPICKGFRGGIAALCCQQLKLNVFLAVISKIGAFLYH